MGFLSRAASASDDNEDGFTGGTSEATMGQLPDVYGQVHPVETTDLVKRKMIEFEDEVKKLMNDSISDNLKIALEKCPDFMTRDFKLKFLQCEVFNADLAARRFVNYWNKRVEILGIDKAFEPFTLDSFNADVITALEAGVIHIIERKGTGQRNLIYVDYSNFHAGVDRKAFVVALWYLLHVIALEDDDCPRRGAIILADAARFRFSQCDKALIELIIKSIKECLPVRLSAYHLCHPPTFVKFFIPIVFMFLAKRMRKRLLVHSGSVAHVLAELDSIYGFGAEHLPIELGGQYKLDIHEWIENRRKLKDARLRNPSMTQSYDTTLFLPDNVKDNDLCRASTATLRTAASDSDDSDSVEEVVTCGSHDHVISIKTISTGTFTGQIETKYTKREILEEA
jgi:CRAL/TRIO domain